MKRLFVVVFLLLPLVLSAQYDRQSLLQPTLGVYNLKGRVQQVTAVQKYDVGNDVNFQETYLFDRTGKLTEYRKRGFGGERVTQYPLTLDAVSEGRQYHFDYDGDIVELLQYDRLERLISSTHYIYAAGGNLAQTVTYTYSTDSGIVKERTVSNYDRHERLASIEKYTADELLLMTEKYKYDRKGNLVRRVQTFYNDDDVTVTTEKRVYTYDNHGNWTQCRYSQNGQPLYTIERIIEYYSE